MKLEKIVMEGFKSFKRKSAVLFPGGFSVITGPNGCGKTCVIDAVSFVLGRGTTRSLRAKKLQELIFHGSRAKSASDFARVTMFFDNTCKSLPMKEERVSVTRRVNKAGVSTYRLNGKVVTRQNLTDLFSKAMVHADGYNIIQQGDVTNVIEMMPTERREIIDDIAGIAEYDDKKVKSEKELERVMEKVREAEIMLEQKDEFVRRLKGDRDAALEYQQIQKEIGLVKASAIWNELQEREKSLKIQDDKLAGQEKELKELQDRIEELDSQIRGGEGKLQDMVKDLDKAQDQIALSKRIAELSSMIDRKRDKIEMNKQEVERIQDMMDRLRGMGSGISPGMKKLLSFPGVFGMVQDLIVVPKQYQIAVDVAGGYHLKDIIVDKTGNAVKYVKFLKENRVGRARFLPLDRITPPHKKPLPKGCIGWLSELIHHEPKFSRAVEYIFSTTACVKNIELAKQISKLSRIRMVTLDGDVMEASGAIFGGFYRKKGRTSVDVSEYAGRRKKLLKEAEILEREIVKNNRELEALAEKEKESGAGKVELQRSKIGEGLEKMREERREAYEKSLSLSQGLGEIKIQKTRVETTLENLRLEWDSMKDKVNKKLLKEKASTLKSRERYMRDRLEQIGAVNMKAIEEYDAYKKEFDVLRNKIDKIVSEKESIEDTIKKIESKRMETFNKTMGEIASNFRKVYSELTNGVAELALDDPTRTDSGLVISASPPGKKLLSIDAQSGGEKTLTALSFLFAIQRHKPAPFYLLDEADAALDKTNTKKFVEMIKKQSEGAQFILISHNDQLIRQADQVYGVTMEDGESKIMGLKIPKNN